MTTTVSNRTRVVAIRHDDKFTAVEQVLDQTKFFEHYHRGEDHAQGTE